MFKKKLILLLQLFLVVFPCIEGAARLNEFIQHYETLDYDPSELHERHMRVKRWAADSPANVEEPEVHLAFQAHQKEFKLRLKRDESVFSPNLHVECDGETLYNAEETSHLFSGHLEGVPGSVVFGSIQNGIFDGKIVTPDETFYVERANKYTLPIKNESLHSVIYSDRNVQDPFESLRTGDAKGCGITEEVAKRMESIQNSRSAVENEKSKLMHGEKPIAKSSNNYEHAFAKYFKETGKNRNRRALKPGTTCHLSIETDHLLWDHISAQEGTQDETKIREEILSLIAQHVKAVNHIYANTLFVGKKSYKNIRFQVQRIKIHTKKACRPENKDKNWFCDENKNVSDFLDLHSLSDHEAFCLAYVFTYRDFTGGSLGLAWLASASGASGGVCEKYKTYIETVGVGGVYKTTRRSLNTGVITFSNYNSRIPPKVSQLTFAHQIGHNFGSPHDYPSKCRPGGPGGNYLMFGSATKGDRPNNSKFSECSVKNISLVLDGILHDGEKQNCFIATDGTFCGNEIVEEGEECDCGFNYEECAEKCCYPRQISPVDRETNNEAQGCRRKPNAVCSPSEGPCCESSCNYVLTNSRRNTMCKSETECSEESFCDGASCKCPVPKAKADFKPCNGGTQVCQGGECEGSICLKFDLKECFVSSNDIADKRKQCELACLDRDGRCRSASELNLPGLPAGLPISLRPGAPCDNFQGYCDVLLQCQPVGNLFSSSGTPSSIIKNASMMITYLQSNVFSGLILIFNSVFFVYNF